RREAEPPRNTHAHNIPPRATGTATPLSIVWLLSKHLPIDKTRFCSGVVTRKIGHSLLRISICACVCACVCISSALDGQIVCVCVFFLHLIL
ncbi:AGAP010045-PA, partial [Anopheles gambiae str. PEST]